MEIKKIPHMESPSEKVSGMQQVLKKQLLLRNTKEAASWALA